MKNQSGLSLIFISIIVIVVIGGGILSYQYLKTPEQGVEKPEIKEGTSAQEQGTQFPEVGTLKNCDFPETINGYTKQQVNDIGALATQEQKEESGLASSIMISYSGWNIVSLTVFATEDRAKTQLALASSAGYKNCEIKGVEGLCKAETLSGSKPAQFQETMIWRESKTVKTVTNTEQKLINESIADTEKRVKEKLELFIPIFKDCSFELKG